MLAPCKSYLVGSSVRARAKDPPLGERFCSKARFENAGILYVFQTFQTAELAEKIRRSAKTQLRGVALSLRQHDMLLFQIVRFSPAADGVLKALRKLAVFRIRYADALM